MANITINEISQNYSYNIGNNSYATIAMPITSCWGPGFEDAAAVGTADDETLESIVWNRFSSNQDGLEAFVSTFRGPASNYVLRQDYSYQMAMSLLTSGYDLLTTRVATGKNAQGKILFVKATTTTTTYEEVDKVKPFTDITLNSDKKSYKIVTISESSINADGEAPSEGKKFKATRTEEFKLVENPFNIRAKYLGSFGNNLLVDIKKMYRISNGTQVPYWNLVVYIKASSGVRTAVENINFVFDIDYSTDQILHIDEVDSKFLTLSPLNDIDDDASFELAGTLIGLEGSNVIIANKYDKDNDLANTTYNTVTDVYEIHLYGGTDLPSDSTTTSATALAEALKLAKNRYCLAYHNEKFGAKYESDSFKYIDGAEAKYPITKLTTTIGLEQLVANASAMGTDRACAIWYREWMFTACYTILGTLADKLAYNPNRIIVPGWDDQDYRYLLNDNSIVVDITDISPLHMRLMDLAYLSRCATAYIDIPRSISRTFIYNESLKDTETGYAQRLGRHVPVSFIESGSVYSTHSALFAPWGKYAYVGGTKQYLASPSFLALLIDRAMIKNQTSQYEWELPTTRRHNLKIGKMDYTISKKYLDEWQSLEGVGVNCITQIPDLGLSIWGNSTLYEVPPATYQALANLSTRKLVNAIEDLSYRCGISITFNYNNDQAYNSFYAGMTPLLDTMRNVGAIEDYYLRMSEDVNGLDNVNANSVIGKIYLVIDGVINDIKIDLIALPPQSSLDDYRA